MTSSSVVSVPHDIKSPLGRNGFINLVFCPQSLNLLRVDISLNFGLKYISFIHLRIFIYSYRF